MSISTTSLPNTISPGFESGATDLANPGAVKSPSIQRFEDAMTRAEAMQPQPVAFVAPDNVSGVQPADMRPQPESFFLAQATPAQPDTTNQGAAQAFEATNGTRIDITAGFGTPPATETAVADPGTGQGIIDGLSRLRGVFDAQEQAITGISPTDPGGTRLLNSSELINLQLEVVKYSMLMDVTSKLAGKSTMTFDTLMKGQ